MSTSFDTYDFNGDPRWQSIESNLYFSTDVDKERILTKRKQRYYKEYIDPSYTIQDTATKQQSQQHDSPSSSTYASSSSRPTSTSTSSSTSSSSSSNNYTSSSTSTSSSSYISNMLTHFHASLHGFFILNVILYLLPFSLEFSYTSFYRCLKIALLTSLIHLYKRYGKPQLNMDYATKIISDDEGQYMFLSILLYTTCTLPTFTFLIPYTIRSTLFVCKYLHQQIQLRWPRLSAQYSPKLQAIISREDELIRQGAILEVLAGILLIINAIFTSNKQFTLVLVYWQYLKLRYTLNTHTKFAFTTVKHTIDSYLYKPMVPRIIQSVWEKICAFLSAQGDMATQERRGEGGGGISNTLSRCTIM